MIVCAYGSVKWRYPKSGFGVQHLVSMMETKSTFDNDVALIGYPLDADSLPNFFHVSKLS
jgi:hypothetical protein